MHFGKQTGELMSHVQLKGPGLKKTITNLCIMMTITKSIYSQDLGGDYHKKLNFRTWKFSPLPWMAQFLEIPTAKIDIISSI